MPANDATRKQDFISLFLPYIDSQVHYDTLALQIFRQFTDKKTQLQKGPGDTIRFTKMNDLPGGGMLPNEDTPIPSQRMSMNWVDVTVHEFGNGIKISRLALEQSPANLLQEAATLLGRNEALIMDAYFRDIYLSSTNRIYYKAGGGGASSSEVDLTFDDVVLKDAIEVLETQNVMPFSRDGDQFWACVIHPHCVRQLRDTTYWQKPHQYSQPEAIWRGEVGRIENVVFFVKSDMPTVVNTTLSSVNYQSILFGAHSVAEAVGVPMEIIPAIPQDYNRWQGLGWYEIVGGDIIVDNIVVLETLA